MKFKNVYDLIMKLGGGEKMVKEVKRIVRLNKKEEIKKKWTKAQYKRLADRIRKA